MTDNTNPPVDDEATIAANDNTDTAPAVTTEAAPAGMSFFRKLLVGTVAVGLVAGGIVIGRSLGVSADKAVEGAVDAARMLAG